MSEQEPARRSPRSTSSTATARTRRRGACVRVMLVAEAHREPGPVMRTAIDVAQAMRDWLASDDRESFVAIHLNIKGRVLSYEVVSVGHLSAAVVHPREVFKAAILANAANVIFVHNHPSGEATPSQVDIDLTRRLIKAGELLGIPVSDHLVVADEGWCSVMDQL